MNWSNLKLPWVDLDWLIDISCQITELDLSANCLVSLPSVIPWGLMNLRKLSLADNQLAELPSVQSSDEIICTRCVLDAHSKPSPYGEQVQGCCWCENCSYEKHIQKFLGCFSACCKVELQICPFAFSALPR